MQNVFEYVKSTDVKGAASKSSSLTANAVDFDKLTPMELIAELRAHYTKKGERMKDGNKQPLPFADVVIRVTTNAIRKAENKRMIMDTIIKSYINDLRTDCPVAFHLCKRYMGELMTLAKSFYGNHVHFTSTKTCKVDGKDVTKTLDWYFPVRWGKTEPKGKLTLGKGFNLYGYSFEGGSSYTDCGTFACTDIASLVHNTTRKSRKALAIKSDGSVEYSKDEFVTVPVTFYPYICSSDTFKVNASMMMSAIGKAVLALMENHKDDKK